MYFEGSVHSTFTNSSYFEIMFNVYYDNMHKTSLQISLHETSMVCGRSIDAYVNVLFLRRLECACVIIKVPRS